MVICQAGGNLSESAFTFSVVAEAYNERSSCAEFIADSSRDLVCRRYPIANRLCLCSCICLSYAVAVAVAVAVVFAVASSDVMSYRHYTTIGYLVPPTVKLVSSSVRHALHFI